MPIFKAVLIFMFFIAVDAYSKTKVAFINPGESNRGKTGSFWIMVHDFMQAAADDLGFELKTYYAERKFPKMNQFAKEIAASKDKPDYVFIVNEKLVAPTL